MTLWGAILKARSRASNRHTSYAPGWFNPGRRLHLTAATCTVSAGAKASSRNRNMAELLAEMPLCELQVAKPQKNKANSVAPKDRFSSTEPEDEFLTVCLLGEGRTSCQPNLICGPGSMFRVAWLDEQETGQDYDVHIVGHELQISTVKHKSAALELLERTECLNSRMPINRNAKGR
ncbi:hypothetical protein KFL_001830225 [Klebsormidium nitens]|uniref:Uncharacterized protein n=1 Tax=Klebsormidium nitens TaxID=105231 RepID=A0A1Y1I058_KLENI|nr:hypothetical protein KFL_001830225 [Klebsormidium nitens]|eukprot:GAQ84295.1 hypothetical protein KFL_001830225 [Klebsormidium nitens]